MKWIGEEKRFEEKQVRKRVKDKKRQLAYAIGLVVAAESAFTLALALQSEVLVALRTQLAELYIGMAIYLTLLVSLIVALFWRALTLDESNLEATGGYIVRTILVFGVQVTAAFNLFLLYSLDDTLEWAKANQNANFITTLKVINWCRLAFTFYLLVLTVVYALDRCILSRFWKQTKPKQSLLESLLPSSSSTQSTVCCICKAKFEMHEEVVELTCSQIHVFHRKCIEGWIDEGKDYCPGCKDIILL